MRVDHYLVQQGVFPSRAKAQVYVSEIGVWVISPAGQKQKITKSNYVLKPNEMVMPVNLGEGALKYVSRSGLKLEHAIKSLKLSIVDKYCLDVGQSTGGFTHCLLEHGAKSIVGVDVGQGQLAEGLRTHARVQYFEKINARSLDQNLEFTLFRGQFDLIVVDVSFISLTKVIPALRTFIKPSGACLALVKPQFELGPECLRRGVVISKGAPYASLEEQFRQYFFQQHFINLCYIDSGMLGKSGNREFFIYGESVRP